MDGKEKMNEINATTIAVLPIGEFDNDLVKNEFDAIIKTIDQSRTNLMVAKPESKGESARRSVQVLMEKILISF